MTRCSFCGQEIPSGRGKMFVRNDAKIFYFCNSKCEKNWKLGRQGKKTRWTAVFRKEKKK